MRYSIDDILTDRNKSLIVHTVKEQQDGVIWHIVHIARQFHIEMKDIDKALKPYRKHTYVYCQKYCDNMTPEFNNNVYKCILEFSNISNEDKITVKKYISLNKNIQDKPGEYLLECYDKNLNLVAIKVGSSTKCKTRIAQINSKQEYSKRNLNIEIAIPNLYFPTVEKYGAFTIENFLHRHFERLGYEQCGNDYFKCAEYSQELIDNDIPLQIMSMIYSSDKIFEAMRNVTQEQLEHILSILAEAEQTGKFPF